MCWFQKQEAGAAVCCNFYKRDMKKKYDRSSREEGDRGGRWFCSVIEKGQRQQQDGSRAKQQIDRCKETTSRNIGLGDYILCEIHINGGRDDAIVPGIFPVAPVEGGSAAEITDDAAEETNLPPLGGPGACRRGMTAVRVVRVVRRDALHDAAASRARRGGPF